MKRTMIMLLAAATVAVSAMPAAANDAMKSVVEPFYTKILTRASGADVAATAEAIISENWQSIGDYSGKIKSRDEFVEQMVGFGQLIPDMTWNIEEMIVSGNRVIVRGRASGTPTDVWCRRQRQELGHHVDRHSHCRERQNRHLLSYRGLGWCHASAQRKVTYLALPRAMLPARS